MIRTAIFAFLLIGTTLTGYAQETSTQLHRLDATAKRMAQKANGKLKSVAIRCHEPETVAALIKKAGYHAAVVGTDMVTATVDKHYLQILSAWEACGADRNRHSH